MAQYTMHFQKYLGDHAEWFRRIGGIATKVVLLGNPAGFETQIQSLRRAGVEIEDRTEPAISEIANAVIQKAKGAC